MPNCKTIAICNQKGGVGILHELNPEEMEEAFRQHLTQRSKEKTANPLTGLVFCADCGAKMYNHRSRGTESKPYPYDAFECSTYKLAGQKRSAACCGHHISAKALRELILETIRAASTFAISDRDAFLEKVRSASQLRQAEAAKETKRRLNKEKKRISELDTIIKKLYESFAVGRITGERFDSLLAEYEAEQKALIASVSEMEMQMSAFAEDTDRAKQFLELARKYTDFSELTTPMINEFIERIIVHAPERIDGDRVQEVEIHLRFIGRFELPVTELSEEEIKRQEFLKKERIRSRERYQKLKSGERTVGVPVTLTCKCCGQEFASKRTNTLFCGPNCRSKFYRQEAAESRSRECTCALGQALPADHGQHHALLPVHPVHPVAGLQGHAPLIGDKARRLRQRHGVGRALPLGLAVVQKALVVPAIGLHGIQRLLVHPVIAVLAAGKQQLSLGLHFIGHCSCPPSVIWWSCRSRSRKKISAFSRNASGVSS